MQKNFILDTNVILGSGTGGAKILRGFENGKDVNNIVILSTVLQELDRKKTTRGEVGYNAQNFIKAVDFLRDKNDGRIMGGVAISDLYPDVRGKLIIEPDGIDPSNMPDYPMDNPDNRIISACISLAKKSPRTRYYFVSNDIFCRVNAALCFTHAGVKIEIQDYHNDRIKLDEYRGFTEIETDDYEKLTDILSKLKDYTDGVGEPGACLMPVEPFFDTEELEEEEFIRIYSGTISIFGVYRNGMLWVIPDSLCKTNAITPRNVLQRFALYALLAPVEEYPVVIIDGPAGTGKTFLAMAAAMDQTYTWESYTKKSHKEGSGESDKKYERILITRSNSIPDGENLGFLPGDIDEKMAPLTGPFHDSLYSLLSEGGQEDPAQINMHIDDLFGSGFIQNLPMAYIRGRSIPRSYIIVDEAQNLTRTQMRDILTRAGEGAKVIILADVKNQIDNPKVDKYTSGFSYAFAKMRGPHVAELVFGEKECVRSPLASMALERLA